MDTTETYIKMCEKAGEIQKVWGEDCGDFYWHEHRNVYIITDLYPVDGDIWLPRQDQLQEMIADCVDHNVPLGKGMYLLQKMVDWNTSPDGWKSKVDASSMEQLWLAFVMKEKYGKTWNGEDWLSESPPL